MVAAHRLISPFLLMQKVLLIVIFLQVCESFSTSTLRPTCSVNHSIHKHLYSNHGTCRTKFSSTNETRRSIKTTNTVVSTSTSTRLSASLSSSPLQSLSSSKLSPAAQWHNKRRKEMISKYASQILPLEQESHGLLVGLPLLLLSNVGLAALSLLSSKLSIAQILAVAYFPGSILSLWQLQINHDCLHGTLLPKRMIKSKSKDCHRLRKYQQNIINWIVRNRVSLHSKILFWCSMPNAFGYYLYLQYGHLTHHKSLGDKTKSNLETLFDSSEKFFEDGDALFVAHRMKLKGGVGPKFKVEVPKLKSILPPAWRGGFRRNDPRDDESYSKSGSASRSNGENEGGKTNNEKTITMSISNSGFSLWKDGHPLRNAIVFASSFLFERILLIINDFVVALTGKNFFFLNKPQSFHNEVAKYCRASCLVKLALWYLSGSWKSLLFLYLAETLWSIPPHPACAMFITNHGSGKSNDSADNLDGCIPSSSTYAGKLYSLFTLGTNYHVEHHDFPTIPLHKLARLQEIAPEYYRSGRSINNTGSDTTKTKRDNVFAIMKKTFSKPEFYACMDAGIRLD